MAYDPFNPGSQDYAATMNAALSAKCGKAIRITREYGCGI
jgi:hypothetical protein